MTAPRQLELFDLPLDPAVLIPSLRDIGYSFESAVADLVDNSVAAGARRVEVRALWNGGKPTVAVIDDGCGMSETELTAAMRFGSRSPLEVRSADDLERFGLGMKTASISQCLKVQVTSRRDGATNTAIWNLERIREARDGRWSVGLEPEAFKCAASGLSNNHPYFLSVRFAQELDGVDVRRGEGGRIPDDVVRLMLGE